MAALRYAARRILAGQAPQPIYRVAVVEEPRRILPAVIHDCSSAYSRRFFSVQRGQADPLTFEEKIRICKRGAHLMFRLTKAVTTMVVCGIVIKLSLDELFQPGYPFCETTHNLKKYFDTLQGVHENPSKKDVNSLLSREAAAELAKIKCMLKDNE